MARVTFPYTFAPDFNRDGVLALGKVYIGEPGPDPKNNPKDATIFKSDDGTSVPAEYPIILSAGGVLQLNGSPATLEIDGEYSIRIDDKNNVQKYLSISEGTTEDNTAAILNALALDLNYSTDTIGTVIITSAVGNLLDEAEYILDLNTDLVWRIPLGIPDGSQVTNLSETGLLTTTNGSFQLKPKQADITQNVENLIKGNQNWNVAGADGQLTSSPQAFVADDEFTLGWKVATGSSLSDIVRIDGETTAPSGGIVEYIYTQDEAGQVNEDDSLFSVTNKSGLQTYAEGLTANGLEIDSTTVAGEVKLSIDFSVYTDGYAYSSVSNRRGQAQPVNDRQSLLSSDSFMYLDYNKYFEAVDEKPTGVNAGSSVVGYQTRTLNTIKNNTLGATLSSNEVTLEPGKYYIIASAPAFEALAHKAIIKFTSGLNQLGESAYVSTLGSAVTRSASDSIFNLSSSDSVFIDHYISSAKASNGLGTSVSGDGISELYARIQIWKLA